MLSPGTRRVIGDANVHLAHPALDGALRICLVLRDGDPDRYQRAAIRWLGRFALEARDVAIEDLRIVADAVDALRDRTADALERLERARRARGRAARA